MRTHLHHLIEEQAAIRSSAPALTYKSVTLTYAQLWRQVDSVAAALTRLGLDRDDRIAVFLDKRIETVTAIFASSVANCVFVPVNPLLRARQVGFIVGDSAARVLITTPERLALLREELKGCSSLEYVLLVGSDPESRPPDEEYAVLGWPDSTVPMDTAAGDSAPANPSAREPGIDLDMAAILYTSGSTGTPKGVVLSHRNLIVGAESVADYLGNTSDDVILAVLPISFDAGFSQLTTAFGVGAHVVLMNYLLPADVVRLCTRHGVTGLTCVPPLWIQIADQLWPAETAAHLRYFANTGGRMPRSTLDRLRTQFPHALPYLMYGLTEAFRSTYLDPAEVDRRPGSIGKAIPNAEILVVRPDGTRCGPGEEGELVHRGALVGLGYWGDAERTAARFRPLRADSDDWRTPELAVWSGDTVVADDEGFLYFVGRADEMIKTSGYRVSPTEIEEVAYDTGLVRDAVALGVSDDRLGQRVRLVIAPVNDVDDFDTAALLAAMKRQLPLYMVPSEVDVRAEIPRSPNGKFDRAKLRDEVTA